MHDFTNHALAMFAGSAFVLYVLTGLGLSIWSALMGLAGTGRGHRSGPYRSDRSAQELYGRSLRKAHLR